MRLLKNITPMEEDFSQWYQDVVVKGNLIEYGATKGAMIFKPIAYGIWEQIQNQLNMQFKMHGIENVYLPLLIPLSYIEKEKAHIAGFAPELATVTKVGTKKLDEPLVIRPTSEVLFGELFAKSINSYNDLPLIYNQWANIVRWEKTTNPFLRNREFLWQEGHTAHNNAQEAKDFSVQMIKLYATFARDYLAMPVIVGQKTESEKFSGAVTTFTIEAMMKDGKALQAGTAHYLGTNFAKAFKIEFKDQNNTKALAFQTSWGVSTRLIGGLIMTHGDNRGIIIPPRIAPYQVDILDLFGHKNPEVKKVATTLYQALSAKFRVRKNFSDKSIGHKAAQSEIEGTPLRIEVGPRDLAAQEVTIVRRDTLAKIKVKIDKVAHQVTKWLDEIQHNLLALAQKRLDDNIVEASSYDELKKLIKANKFVRAAFIDDAKFEAQIKAETFATSRCILFNAYSQAKPCIMSQKPTKDAVIFARAY